MSGKESGPVSISYAERAAKEARNVFITVAVLGILAKLLYPINVPLFVAGAAGAVASEAGRRAARQQSKAK